MIDTIVVDNDLANGVEEEMLSLKPKWSYYTLTTEFYSKSASVKERQIIDKHAATYGPVIDTQRFTYTVYQIGSMKPILFASVRNDPNSYYRKTFKHLPNLIDYLQTTYIPKTHVVDRFICNMQTIRPQWSMNAIHPDLRIKDAITILYYVNDSDGDTYFFDDEKCIKRVSPVKGTAAMYASNTLHAGSTPVHTQTRVVINMVFAPKATLTENLD